MSGKHRKLSDRAAILLALVIDHTKRDGSGKLTSYFYPGDGVRYSSTFQHQILLGGSGDAAALRMLASRGLIEHKRETGDYSFAATEAGVLFFDRKIRQSGRLLDLQKIMDQNYRVLTGGNDREERGE